MKLSSLFCVVAVGIIVLSSGASATLQDDLTDDNFWNVVKKEPFYFAKFYVKTCPHCIRLAPTWERLAESLTGVIRMGQLEARENPKLSTYGSFLVLRIDNTLAKTPKFFEIIVPCDFRVIRVPAMFILKNVPGKEHPEQIEYQGDRSFADLVSFVLKALPIREVKVGQHKSFTTVVGSLPFRALLIEEEGNEQNEAARKVFEKMHGQFGSKFLFGRLSLPAGGSALTKLEKDFPDVRTLPALLVSQSEYSEVFDGSLSEHEAAAEFFSRMSDKQTKVAELEKPQISHTSFSLIFVLICIILVGACIVYSRGSGMRSADAAHKSA